MRIYLSPQMPKVCNKNYTLRIAVFIAVFFVFFGFPAVESYAAGRQKLFRHVPKEVFMATPEGDLPDTDVIKLAISLPLRNREGLDKFLQEVYDPQNPNYRKFLSPEQFAAAYGPAEQDYKAVQDFAKKHGLKVIGTHGSRTLMEVSGAVKDVKKAFNVNLRKYRRKNNSVFYAPDTDPSLDLDVPLHHVTGLDNHVIPHHAGTTPTMVANYTFSGGTILAQGTNVFGVSDLRHAYCNGVTLTGTGQSIGLVELDGFNASDVTLFKTINGLASVPNIITVLVNGFSGVAGASRIEVIMDIDAVIDMAYGAANIVSVEGDMTGASFEASLASLAAPPYGVPLCMQVSSSWTGDSDNFYVQQPLLQFKAQGQTYFQAAGDELYFASDPGDNRDDPNQIIVGGTDLSLSNGGTVYVNEYAWNNGYGGGTGGGILTNMPMPSYQSGLANVSNGGSTTHRNTPDVSAASNGVLVVCDGYAQVLAGTSFSVPLWAGFMALVHQQYVATTGSTTGLGFIAPALYAIGKGPNYNNDFHDVTLGNNYAWGTSTGFNAVTGYDLCTGWGSPKGQPLINDLCGNVTPAATPTSGFTKTRTPTASSTVLKTATSTRTVTSTSTKTFTPSVTATGTPSYTVTPTRTPTVLPNTATNTMTSTATGTVTMTFTATTTPTITMSSTASYTATYTSTITETASNTVTPTITESFTASYTATHTPTITETQTYTATTTITATHTDSPTPSVTPTDTATPTITATATQTNTASITETITGTVTVTATASVTPTTPPDTATPTFTPANTFTATPSATATSPPFTPTVTLTSTPGRELAPDVTPVVFPNPWVPGKGPLSIRMNYKLSNEDVEIKIYTSAYRLVYRYIKQSVTTGPQTGFVFKLEQGADTLPENLGPGVYYLRVRAESGYVKIIKLVVMK